MAIENRMWLQAAHIKGEANVVADALSRGKKDIPWTEWSLSPKAVQTVFRKFGRPNIDLFASRHNNKLPTYCAWEPDPGAWAIDSLSISWEGLWAYAYPPISLIPRVLNKVRTSSCRVLLIAPWWPLRPWFPGLLHLLMDIPALLPRNPRLLQLKPSTLFYPEPELLKLAVWPLCGNASYQTGFRQKLKDWSWPAGDQEHSGSTQPSSTSLVAGVRDGVSIPMQCL
jgi:hypothetical protein